MSSVLERAVQGNRTAMHRVYEKERKLCHLHLSFCMVYERLPRDESPAGTKIRYCSRFEKRWDCSKGLLQNSRIKHEYTKTGLTRKRKALLLRPVFVWTSLCRMPPHLLLAAIPFSALRGRGLFCGSLLCG